MTLTLTSFRKTQNIQITHSKRFDCCTKRSTFIFAIIAIGLLFSFSVAIEKEILKSNYNVYAQSEQRSNDNDDHILQDGVTINLDSIKFAPLTNSNTNQLKVDITYQTNDPKLVNTIMAGVMKVYTSDGTLIKTSTIPNGYVLGQAGPMQFATSFEDKAIQNVKAEIAMTDTAHVEKVSNTLMVEASLER